MQTYSRALVSHGAEVWAALGSGRLMGTVAKSGNRSAAHGAKTPATETVKREETEEVIEKGKKEKHAKTEEIENEVGLKPNNPGLQSGG